jgi:hypothetical protein
VTLAEAQTLLASGKPLEGLSEHDLLVVQAELLRERVSPSATPATLLVSGAPMEGCSGQTLTELAAQFCFLSV